MLAPTEPPIFHADLPGTGGRVGGQPEDFRVEEVPLYSPSGEGAHLYVRLQKRGWTTPDATRFLAKAAGVSPRDVGYAGLKDKHAITTQWVSLPVGGRPVDEWRLPDGLEVLEVSHHKNKLRTGHLLANRFVIILKDVETEALANARALAERLARVGLPNFFGHQRFGHRGRNLDKALFWLRANERRGPKGGFKNKLHASVIQSEAFNRYAIARIERGLETLLLGEVVRLDGSGSRFVVTDLDAEAKRYASGDLHPQGPLFGPKMYAAADRALELETEVVESLGLSEAERAALARFAPGTRRDLMLRPEALEIQARDDGELGLSFTLPPGSYATQVTRELTRAAWFVPSEASSADSPSRAPSGIATSEPES